MVHAVESPHRDIGSRRGRTGASSSFSYPTWRPSARTTRAARRSTPVTGRAAFSSTAIASYQSASWTKTCLWSLPGS